MSTTLSQSFIPFRPLRPLLNQLTNGAFRLYFEMLLECDTSTNSLTIFNVTKWSARHGYRVTLVHKNIAMLEALRIVKVKRVTIEHFIITFDANGV